MKGNMTFEEFKKGFEELFNNYQTQYHLSQPEFYEELPYNCAKKHLKGEPRKHYRDCYWFTFHFDEERSVIITYEQDWTGGDKFMIYYQNEYYDKVEGSHLWTQGRTEEYRFACDHYGAWLQVISLMTHVYRFHEIYTNNTFYFDLNGTKAFRNGDHPIVKEYGRMSFFQCLRFLWDAKKHPQKEWKGQVIGVSLSGIFGVPEYVIEL